MREALPGEEWRPIPGWEDLYEVSNLGRVYSIRRPHHSRSGRILRTQPSPSGHLFVSLRHDPYRKQASVHSLVATAFIGLRPEGQEVCHIDGDPTNNTLPNLRYGTRSENMRDRVRHGTHSNTRKTHCPSGHPYDEANTRRVPSRPSSRYCRACELERRRSA